jgi:hypothetical protein
MIDFIRQLPAWLRDHPWALAGSFILCLALGTATILANPDGRQLREKLRRRR